MSSARGGRNKGAKREEDEEEEEEEEEEVETDRGTGEKSFPELKILDHCKYGSIFRSVRDALRRTILGTVLRT
ncbi:hypothetical protein QA089_005134 [Meyerozyma guilliermondii]